MSSHHSAIAVMALLPAFHPCPARSADPSPTGFATTLRYADFGTLGSALQILTDRAGNVYIGGVTQSDDFPLVHALISNTTPKANAGFIAKVNATGTQLAFSTRL